MDIRTRYAKRIYDGLLLKERQGAYQMTEEQEKDVLEKCIALAKRLTGKQPVGYRAPLYQIRESTIKLLVEHGFSYGESTELTQIPTLLSHILSYDFLG